MSRHKQYTVFVLAALATVLTQFQNCAPAQTGVATSGEVRIIDRWDQSKLEFQATSYYVGENVDSVNIEGFCDSESVNWEISKISSDGVVQLIESGVSSCEAGIFSLASTVHQQLQNCSDVAEVSASLPDESLHAKTSVRIQCF